MSSRFRFLKIAVIKSAAVVGAYLLAGRFPAWRSRCWFAPIHRTHLSPTARRLASRTGSPK